MSIKDVLSGAFAVAGNEWRKLKVRRIAVKFALTEPEAGAILDYLRGNYLQAQTTIYLAIATGRDPLVLAARIRRQADKRPSEPPEWNNKTRVGKFN